MRGEGRKGICPICKAPSMFYEGESRSHYPISDYATLKANADKMHEKLLEYSYLLDETRKSRVISVPTAGEVYTGKSYSKVVIDQLANELDEILSDYKSNEEKEK